MRAYFSLCARRMHRKSEWLSFSQIYGCKAQGEQMLFAFYKKQRKTVHKKQGQICEFNRVSLLNLNYYLHYCDIYMMNCAFLHGIKSFLTQAEIEKKQIYNGAKRRASACFTSLITLNENEKRDNDSTKKRFAISFFRYKFFWERSLFLLPVYPLLFLRTSSSSATGTPCSARNPVASGDPFAPARSISFRPRSRLYSVPKPSR